VFDWKGEQLLARVRAAEEGALAETDQAIVGEAKRRVHKKSGRLQSRIREITPPQATGSGFRSEVGVDDVPYAIYQEKGLPSGSRYAFTPYLRPSAQIEGSKLGGRIAKRLR
jgi:hypothetical protein